MTSPLSQPITVCTAVVTRLGHALCNHPACHEHNAHVLLHCRLKISSLQMSLLFVGFITVYIYGKTSFALHIRLEIVCYAVNIANIMRGSSPIRDPLHSGQARAN